MINVLIVDDSPTCGANLMHLLSSSPLVGRVHITHSGLEAMRLLSRQPVQLVIMDVNMPDRDGYQVSREIMQEYPTPIVVTSSSWRGGEAVTSLMAMEVGAVTALPKPPGPFDAHGAEERAEFLRTVLAMAEVRVVRRRRPPIVSDLPQQPGAHHQPPMRVPLSNYYGVVAIATSIGGPPVLKQMLELLPANFPLPVVVVQHISIGFLTGLCGWLSSTSQLRVKVAEQQEPLLAGSVYFAPERQELTIVNGQVRLSECLAASNICPSATSLYESVAVDGQPAIGVILTGMGSDGAVALRSIRDHHGYTIAQNEESCVVYGMPAEAVRHGSVMEQLAPPAIVARLITLAQRER